MKKDYYKILNLAKDSEISDELVEKNYTIIQNQIEKMKEKTPNDSALLECERRAERAYSALRTIEGRKEYNEFLVYQEKENLRREIEEKERIEREKLEKEKLERQRKEELRRIVDKPKMVKKPVIIKNLNDMHEITYKEKDNFKENIKVEKGRTLEAYIMYKGELGKIPPKKNNIDNER